MHDLLSEEIIGVHTSGGQRYVSLPQLLGLLSAGEVEGYTGLRAHQADPWHVFLIQLAASILARQPKDRLPPDVAYWRDGLLALAGGQAEAWHLVVEDTTRPAFLQHPWQSGESDSAAYNKVEARTPDQLDVPVTSKNHDVKIARIISAPPEAWLFALLTLQTTVGYSGRRYGVIRMNSGSGSRPIVSWVESLTPAGRFLNELPIVRDMRSRVIRMYGYSEQGVVLTWLDPWNRSGHQYTLSALEPWFIEAARPTRLVRRSGDAIEALRAVSQERQIGPRMPDAGDVGDPWVPINQEHKEKGSAALTIATREGFTPRVLTDLLFEQNGYTLTDLQRPRPAEQPGWFVASVLARTDKTSEGFHRIELPVPAKARVAFSRPKGDPDRGQLAQIAASLLSDAQGAADALRAALFVLVMSRPVQPKNDKHAASLGWVESFAGSLRVLWEQHYFPTLWRACDEPAETVQRDWQAWLVQATQDLLSDASTRLPLPDGRRWRGIARSRSALFGALRKKHLLPELTAHEEDAA